MMRQATDISYLPFGRMTGLTYGNGVTLTQGYDNQYRISSIVTGSILNLAYGYDPNGNIISILDVVNPPGGEIFDPPGTYTYQTGTNKLTHIEGTPPIDLGYDANANITTENTRTYVYDLSNQLIRVLQNTNQVAEYTYNGAGQRIKKVTQTETKFFHYDLRGHLIAETNQSGQMLAEYVYLGDQLLSIIKPGEAVYYFHNDHLGTPQVLTDDSQTIAWKAVYSPFGEGVTSVATVENPFRFPGQYYDQETGLHYNYFRYYNPRTGRYITPDPIGLEGGINLFVYVAGNPISLTDPWGLHGPGYIPPGSHPCISTGTCHYVENSPVNGIDPGGICGDNSSYYGPPQGPISRAIAEALYSGAVAGIDAVDASYSFAEHGVFGLLDALLQMKAPIPPDAIPWWTVDAYTGTIGAGQKVRAGVTALTLGKDWIHEQHMKFHKR